MANYTYTNGIGAKVGETPMPNCFNRHIIELADGRAFYDKTGTYIGRDYVESKDCYEIVKSKSGNEYAVNLCNGCCYSMSNEAK